MDSTVQRLREFIVREFKPEIPLDEDSLLIEQGIIDSLAVFTLIGFMEEQFGIKIDPEDVTLDNCSTIRAINELVESARSSRWPSKKEGT